MAKEGTREPGPINDQARSGTPSSAEDEDGELGSDRADEGVDSWDEGGEEALADGLPDEQLPAPDEPPGSAASLSQVARDLTGSRSQFIRALGRQFGPELSSGARRALQQAARPDIGEAAAWDHLAASLLDAVGSPAVVAVFAALAARAVARSLLFADGEFGMPVREALLAACHDAGRELAAALGPTSLNVLLPVARRLGRKAAERGEPADQISTAVRGIAARLSADPALVWALGGTGDDNDHLTRRGLSGLPRRIVLHGPVEIAIHPR